ncbi:MAG: TIGR00297 family protein [Methanocorpusculum sp.]|nr:TIGR00297 family protein [Methanocorpusculum sp.]
MDVIRKQLILLLCSTALLIASPFVDFRILALAGIIFSALMYFIGNIRYFSIGAAVLSLLYGIGIIPASAFFGPLVMVLFGELLRTLSVKTGHSLAVFGAGSAAALIFAMLYTKEFEPIVGSLAIVLFEDLEFLVDLRTLAFAILLCAAFGYFAYRAKTIDLTGVFSAVLFGVILISFTGTVSWFIIILVFFILGSAFTKFKYSEKEFLGVAQGKHGKRGYKNAFANAGVGVAAAILFGVTGDMIYAAVFLGSVSTATADTLASEIGVTGGNPVMITTLKRCPPGTNGGVTLIGEAACVIGALIIAGLGFLLGIAPWYVCLISAAAGVAGTNLDSLYGAVLENRGVFGNSGTNLLATLSGGLVAAGLYAVFIFVL